MIRAGFASSLGRGCSHANDEQLFSVRSHPDALGLSDNCTPRSGGNPAKSRTRDHFDGLRSNRGEINPEVLRSLDCLHQYAADSSPLYVSVSAQLLDAPEHCIGKPSAASMARTRPFSTPPPLDPRPNGLIASSNASPFSMSAC
jgi:hypothetical protein